MDTSQSSGLLQGDGAAIKPVQSEQANIRLSDDACGRVSCDFDIAYTEQFSEERRNALRNVDTDLKRGFAHLRCSGESAGPRSLVVLNEITNDDFDNFGYVLALGIAHAETASTGDGC